MYIARDDKRSRGVAAVVVGPTGELVSAKTTHFRGTVAISSVFSTVTAAASSTIPDHSVAVAAAAAAVTGWEDVPDGCHVRTLDETDFLEAVGGDRCVLVFFHARWCSSCGPFRPAFAAAAVALSRDGCADAAAVDCTRDFRLAMACGVRTLPAVIAFTRHGRRATEYVGDRSADDLRRFACRAATAEVAVAAKKPARSVYLYVFLFVSLLFSLSTCCVFLL